MRDRKNRPVFLNLIRIHMPVTAVLSIMHRIFGVLMVILLPVTIYLFSLSLESPEGYTRVIEIFSSSCIQWVGVIVIWLLAHHLFAGIRYLLLDLDVGISRTAARLSAWIVHGVTALVVLLYIWRIL